MNTKQNINFLLLIIFNIFLILIIVVISVKIINLKKGSVKGTQYVTKLNKEDLIFDSNNKELKYFYEPKPNSETVWKPDWLGYEVRNKINADSLNEEKEYPIQKGEKTYRIITLGDSFTYGTYVKTTDNYSKILENKLNKQLKCDNIKIFEVINLGVGGYDIELTLERFIKIGVKYNPDIVLWLIHDWNFLNINELMMPIKEELREQGISEYDPKTNTYLNTTEARKIIIERYGESILFDYQKKIMSSLIQEYGKYQFQLFSFPSLSIKYKQLLNKLIVGSNFRYTDKIYDISGDKLLTLADGHPNNKGHQVIANNIFDYLHNNFFADCVLHD